MVGFQALVLALASSTDNFMVGISVGLDLMKSDKERHYSNDNGNDNGNDAVVDDDNNNTQKNDVQSRSTTITRRRQSQQQQQSISQQQRQTIPTTKTTTTAPAPPPPPPTSSAMLVLGNCIISTSNAMGAYLATSGGSHMITSMMNLLLLLMSTSSRKDHDEDKDSDSDSNGEGYDGDDVNQQVASLLSSIAFGFLAFQEVNSVRDQQKQDKEEDQQQREERQGIFGSRYHIVIRAFQLAVPMTLNNLAGGLAGGAVGITPSQSFVYGWIVSFVTMAVGYWIGSYYQQQLAVDPSLISALLFGILSIFALLDTLS